MPTHHDGRIFHTTIFIATIFAFVMSSVGAQQRSNAPPLKRAETTDPTDANGNRVIRKAGASQSRCSTQCPQARVYTQCDWRLRQYFERNHGDVQRHGGDGNCIGGGIAFAILGAGGASITAL